MEPLVSVIVPVYNVEKYIIRCIDSIIAQTYKNLEIILVDDGATDSSGSICDDYAKRDNRIRVIHQENGGLSAARNSGLNSCNGQYVVLVDSDDYIETDYIGKMLGKALEDDCDIVICNYKMVDEAGRDIANDNYTFVQRDDILSGMDLLRLFENRSYRTFFDVVWNKMYKKILFDGIRFPEGISVVEDIAVMPTLYYLSNRIAIVPECLYRYVIREGSLSHQKQDFVTESLIRLKVFEDRLINYKNWDVKDITLSHLIHMYSLYANPGINAKKRCREIQHEYRKVFLKAGRMTCLSRGKKIKLLLAFISMKIYNALVNARKGL